VRLREAHLLGLGAARLGLRARHVPAALHRHLDVLLVHLAFQQDFLAPPRHR
jgi:hypothetical protein